MKNNKPMKKILLLLLIFSFVSCQKYDEISNPQLNINGRWDVVKVKVVIDKVNFNSHVTVLSERCGRSYQFLCKTNQ